MQPFAMAKHLAIVGPTACGKSRLAMAIARRSGDCELVSLDSMQVYRGMDIGTAKATRAERDEIAHHLIDVVDCSDEWTVARAQRDARAAIADIESRGHRAILVGGTGLYVQAVIDNLTMPGEDLVVRAELEAATSLPGGLLAAWHELQAVDPTAASRIDEHNQRRIVRALEVIRITGQPFSSFGSGVFDAQPAVDALRVGLWWPRALLGARIEQRFVAMREAGLVDEVRALASRLSRTARQAIGYKELLAATEGVRAALPSETVTSAPDELPHASPRESPDELPHESPDELLDDAFDLAVRRTRSFARRQRMWFRRDPHIVWWRGAEPEHESRLTDAILACWRGTS